MNKVLVAVEDKRAAKSVLYTLYNLMQAPEELVVLHVQRLEGNSLMIDMLGEPELSTLRESLQGTEHKERLDKESAGILDFYKKEITEGLPVSVKTVVRDGNPANEILKVAEEENAEMIVLGYQKKGALNKLVSGSVAQEVQERAEVPVLLAKRPAVCEEPYTWRDAYYAMSFFTAVVLLLFIIGMTFGKSGAILP